MTTSDTVADNTAAATAATAAATEEKGREVLGEHNKQKKNEGKETEEEEGEDFVYYAENPIPVTILSGFLGSGKTTLLKHILESNQHQKKIAVIVNDMAELNIDAMSTILQTTSDNSNTMPSIVQTEREVVSLQNGCICCTLRGDLIREIARIRSSNDFDYVLIESTGIAEPQQVAQAFVFDPVTQQLATSDEGRLWTQARLDTCVTMIDAHTFVPYMETLQQFHDRFTDGLDTKTPEGIQEGEKSISNLLMEQVEFANIIVLNKIDLVSEEEQRTTVRIIQSLNPTAKILSTSFAKIDVSDILDTQIFDMQKASTAPGWIQTIRQVQEEDDGHASPVSGGEADEYGVGSYVYRARIPFHPARIAQWVDSILHFANEWKAIPKEKRTGTDDPKFQYMLEHYGNILRAKGFIWLAEHDTFMLGFAQSGRIGSIHPIMPWYTMIPQDQWGVPPDSNDFQVITSKFQEPHGDRRQEMVFIGTHLKVDAIQKSLDKCLLTKKELKRYTFYSDKGSLGK